MCPFLTCTLLSYSHRRYDLVFDSAYLGRTSSNITAETTPESDSMYQAAPGTYIYFYQDYQYYSTSRPRMPRLEIEMQITYRVQPSIHRRVLQSLHILTAIRVVCHLTQRGSEKYDDGVANPFQGHLPIVKHNKRILRRFQGPTIAHFVLRSIYQLLSEAIIDPDPSMCI